MSPSVSVCGAWCLLALLCALPAVEVSAARLLHSRAVIATPAASASVVDTERDFSRRLMSCSTGCSNYLGSATNFGVLAGSTVTNTGATFVQGDVGVEPGTQITGFYGKGEGMATGDLHRNDSSARQAQADAHFGFSTLLSLTPTANLTGKDLGGLTLYQGVYTFAKGAQLTGSLILDGQGDEASLFVFQMGSTFVTSVASEIVLFNGSQPCNVYFQVGTSATIHAYSAIVGTIIADQQVTAQHNATFVGSIIGLNSQVTMDSLDVLSQGECGTAPNNPPFPPTAPPSPPSLPSPPQFSDASPSSKPSSGTKKSRSS